LILVFPFVSIQSLPFIIFKAETGIVYNRHTSEHPQLIIILTNAIFLVNLPFLLPECFILFFDMSNLQYQFYANVHFYIESSVFA